MKEPAEHLKTEIIAPCTAEFVHCIRPLSQRASASGGAIIVKTVTQKTDVERA